MVDKVKIDLDRKRQLLESKISTIDAWLDTLESKITDSKDVYRDVVYTDETTIAAISGGTKDDSVSVEANPFDTDLLMLKGVVEVQIEGGKSHVLDSNNKHLFLPKETNFLLTGVGDNNAMIQVTKHKP